MNGRAEFPPRVRKLIAERAGYRCSNPDCRKQTLGPGPGEGDVACIGTASHIYAAALGGPRGTGGLTFERRQEASNGIWLCPDHGRLIDANDGRNFPADLLRGWRELHEAYLRLEMGGAVVPVGLISKITVHQGPTALAARSVNLSMLNLVVGYNNSGKSTLLNLLAHGARPGPWLERPWIGGLTADIRWFDPRPHTLRLHANDGLVKYDLDQRSVPFVATPYRCVFLRHIPGPLDCLADIASRLDLDPATFLSVLVEVPNRVRGEISGVEVVDGVPIVHRRFTPWPIRLDRSASCGEVWTVLLEAAIALAQMYGEAGPTLLLVDDFGDFFDHVLIWKMFKLLTDRTAGFQTMVATHCVLPAETRRAWSTTAFCSDEDAAFIGV